MSEELPVELFVPANALQHPSNPEGASMNKRAGLAVVRHHLYQDFQRDITESELPYVFISSMNLNKRDIGYDVFGFIKVDNPVGKVLLVS